ncbi:DMT family transporter [Undibacterium sp.]|jgi:drug/metabolite transporter (DMT)-like permease|uniref:DMT family transporter n=1 Tax=Undibacterium sp. TaxID=1914977 RepID=UPI002B6B1813|nr:DMT family transporter [Undibacterium sp.]HTD05313.1 DMT family transporter [Undibacterium sp.]
MTSKAIHRKALFLMISAASLWSIAGVLTRQLHAAHGFEVTFWRSLFAGAFVAAAMFWQHKSQAVSKLFLAGWFGLISGFMWAAMFCCFMIALTMTTVANTLIVMSVTPLLTALLAWIVLRHQIVPRTWLAIAVALAGMLWMFAGGMSSVDARGLAGMLIATGIPVAMSVNVVVLKKAGKSVDLIPAVLIGAVISCVLMLPLAMPLRASQHDVAILAILGVLQLGFPCMLMVSAARNLSAPEISLLGLLEVLLGPIWAWLGAGEVPARETLAGGGVVLAALIFNELLALREDV